MKTVSSPWIEALPDPIRASLGPGPFTRCRIGLSGAEVWLSEAQALKIAPVSIESETERTALRWLQGRLPVPALLADARENGKDYLLTSRLDAVPAIDDALLDDPDRLLIFLSGALRALRSVKTDGCPLPDATGAKLRAARENPQAYKSLSVRVSGWNARFVTLNEEWQNMVIERTARGM